ncbi:MAG: rhomboid family intramembrane serine protease [Nitrospina sp.]|jgi:membrane associated rhomboid family serine protease|nr:rhomboid family intramembrane serine protease [Nitrospina sp.]MBT6600062.1 rhomboid family intramembrane serine protease [Nitrospina sp.]
MIPLKDENPTKSFPLITIVFIISNALIFLYQFTQPINMASTFETFGLVPIHLIQSPISTYPTIFSSMFLHSGIGHLAGNMLYLWIFGNNIEDTLGKFRFVIFYLVCGTLASLGHILTDFQSEIPMVGASGAISGILGAYLILFPFARVKTLIFLGFLITIIRIPAIVLLVIWILIQVFSGVVSGDGGVAWFAHIGGFVAGMLLILPFQDLKNR